MFFLSFDNFQSSRFHEELSLNSLRTIPPAFKRLRPILSGLISDGFAQFRTFHLIYDGSVWSWKSLFRAFSQ